jgi:2,4-dienoyl-CoA reductase (NADPH2)
VTLFEKSDRLGGQVPTAASVPSRAEFLDITRNLVAAAQRLGVDVKLLHEATADELVGEAPAPVIVATGAVPQKPWWAGDLAQIVDVRDVLEGRARPRGRVLVVDELGFHQATSVAELLADRGCYVEVATPGMVVGQDLGITLDLETWNVKAAAKGILQLTDVVPMGAEEGITVTLQHHPTGTDVTRRVDWVVCAVQQRADDALWHALKGAPFPVHRVGDCVAPRRAHAAVVEGHRAAVSL